MAHTYKRAGVLVFVHQENETFAVLQRRGKWKIEDGRLQAQKFPGLCQVTCLEKAEPEDADVFATAKRALLEECGLDGSALGKPLWANLFDDGQTCILGIVLTVAGLEAIRWEWGTGGPVLVPNSVQIKKKSGTDGDFNDYGYGGEITMFEDERRAVINGFTKNWAL